MKSSLERQKTSIDSFVSGLDESKIAIENLSGRVSGLESMIPEVLSKAYERCYMSSPEMYGYRASGGGGDTFDRTDGRTRDKETAAVTRTARAKSPGVGV